MNPRMSGCVAVVEVEVMEGLQLKWTLKFDWKLGLLGGSQYHTEVDHM